MFSIRNNNIENALAMIDKVYHQDEDRQQILKTL
jgi:hypothetical protein